MLGAAVLNELISMLTLNIRVCKLGADRTYTVQTNHRK